jgi:purine-binding chemotaxis protein CheW
MSTSALSDLVALRLCTFSLSDLHFGIEMGLVEEAVHGKPVTKVPLSASTMAGVLNLRGRILSAIDLRTRLGLPPREDGMPPHLVVRTSHGAVSLVVDDLDGVVEVSSTQQEPPPPHLSSQLGDLVTEVYKLDGRLLLVLDIERATQP